MGDVYLTLHTGGGAATLILSADALEMGRYAPHAISFRQGGAAVRVGLAESEMA